MKCKIAEMFSPSKALLVFMGMTVIVASARQDPPFQAVVDPALEGDPAWLGGQKFKVGVIVDPLGHKVQFVESELIFYPQTEDERTDFDSRWAIDIYDDGTIPDSPPDIQNQAREIPRFDGYLRVQVGTAVSDYASIEHDANSIGLTGTYTFSSEDGLSLFGLILEEITNGRRNVDLNLVFQPAQCCPTRSQEYPWDPSAPNPALDNEGYWDAFTQSVFRDRDIGIIESWQLMELFGLVDQRIPLCIIDNGFVLNADFPRTLSWDFVDEDDNVTSLEGNYHGTKCLSLASAVLNNRFGLAGTGGQVALPMPFRHDLTFFNTAQAIRTATAWGAQIISMSFGGYCGWWCQTFGELSGMNKLNAAIDEAIDNGVVLVCAAHNQEMDIGDPGLYLVPAEGGTQGRKPLVVAAINLQSKMAVRKINDGWGSNYGSVVDIWAPGAPDTSIVTTATPDDTLFSTFVGTSAATPYVAGVVAMIKAINPTLSADEIRTLIRSTAVSSADDRVIPGVINATGAVQAAAAKPGAVPPLPDEFEPNDLSVPAALGSGEYCLNLNASDSLDVFWFLLQDYRNVQITPCPLFMQYKAHSLEAGNHDLAPSLPFSGVLSPGSYFLIFRSQQTAFYRLNLDIGEPAVLQPDAHEPNDLENTATDIVFPVSHIGDEWIAEDLSLHRADDVDYFRLTLPELPNDSQRYEERLVVLAEFDKGSASPTFHLSLVPEVYPEKSLSRALCLENVRLPSPDGKLCFRITDYGPNRVKYRLVFGYDRWPVDQPAKISPLPNWLLADSSFTLDLPDTFLNGSWLKRIYPANPKILAQLYAGILGIEMVPDVFLMKWTKSRDFNLTVRASTGLNIELLDSEGDIVDSALCPFRGQDKTASAALYTQYLQVKNLQRGYYGLRIKGEDFPVFYQLLFDTTGTSAIPTSETRQSITASLSQNFPNPFNPKTEIIFTVAHRTHVTVSIYNILGKLVDVITDREYGPGRYSLRWNGTSRDGLQLANGIYLYVLSSSEGTLSKKMLLLR